MRAIVQRVSSASVTVRPPGRAPDASEVSVPEQAPAPAERVVGSIGEGLVVLVGVTHDDSRAEVTKMADKLWNLRVFPDGQGAMNRSSADRAAERGAAELLVVSQFTVYGDTRKGRRPSFVAAARPEAAEPLIDHLVAALRGLGATVATGRFRADMAVSLVNDGPVTLLLEV
jgi:D-tyrosyl-tRNA(Tyr) deacylase